MRWIAAILIALLVVLMPAAAASQEMPEHRSEIVQEGERAPFTGFLFDRVAMIAMLIKAEHKELKAGLELIHQSELHRIEIDAIEERHSLMLAAEIDKRELLLEDRDAELTELATLLDKSSSDDIWYLVGGFAGGALLAGGIAAIVVAAQ